MSPSYRSLFKIGCALRKIFAKKTLDLYALDALIIDFTLLIITVEVRICMSVHLRVRSAINRNHTLNNQKSPALI